VIDDEPVVRAYVRAALERRGYGVVEATDGRSGIAALEHNAIDLVLLDMTMPDLDGAEVVRRLRTSGHRVPIVLASGHVDREVQDRLAPGSYQGFLSKPFGVDALTAAIERALTEAPKRAPPSPGRSSTWSSPIW